MIKKIIICSFAILCLTGCGFNEKQNLDDTNNNESNVSNENIQSSYTMEKVVAGKYSFMVPNNGDKKYSNGDSQQTFYSTDGERGRAWYALGGPIDIPENKNEALNMASSSGTIVEFKYDKSNGIEQAIFVNKLEDTYEGLRVVSNLNDTNDCMWLSIKGTDKKLVEEILNSLEW